MRQLHKSINLRTIETASVNFSYTTLLIDMIDYGKCGSLHKSTKFRLPIMTKRNSQFDTAK